MLTETLQLLAVAADGQLRSGDPDAAITGVFSDTRSPVKGGLFVALRGDRFDGNQFLREAIAAGAAAVLFDREEAARGLRSDVGAILVKDSRDGFLGIAAKHREKHSALAWLGVTGSVGKSTTKEMIGHILTHGAKWNIHKAKGSFNNAVGLSHTVLDATPEHRAAVLELGTNHPGEIRQLARVARPSIAVITCAAESHLEAFHTVGNVALEKSEILSFQQQSDYAILNCDDVHFGIWRDRAKGAVISFGQSDRANLRAKHVELDANGCAKFIVRFGDGICECALQVPGLHQVSNALAAIGAAVAAGVRLETAVHAMSTFSGISRRFTVQKFGGVTVIDDAYNANPASFTAAIETLKAHSARKFVIAGDMLELGEESPHFHAQLGRSLSAAKLHKLFTVGAQAEISHWAALECGMGKDDCRHFAAPEEAAAALHPLLREGDVVLVKGSHGVHLERCCEALQSSLSQNSKSQNAA